MGMLIRKLVNKYYDDYMNNSVTRDMLGNRFVFNITTRLISIESQPKKIVVVVVAAHLVVVVIPVVDPRNISFKFG